MKPCKEWMGCRNADGYGRKRHLGKVHLTHRLAMAEHLGVPIKALANIDVLHRCDNPPCHEITHLFCGDAKENMADMISKGRQVIARGSQRKAKLTEAQVIELRRLWNEGTWKQRELAAKYGISGPRVSMIVNRKEWKHI